MTFSESERGLDVQASKTLPELETELSAIQSERTLLKQDIRAQWRDIPELAFTYIATHCPQPELLSLAIDEVRLLLSEDPTALDDLEIMPFLLNDCLSKAQYAFKVQLLNEVTETEKNLLSTKAVLADITKHTANLKGRAKLNAAREYLNSPDVPEAVRLELARRFNLIAVTLDQMSSVFADEASQAGFEAIVNSASFDLSAPDMANTFAQILTQVEASDTFSEDQKMKLRQIVTGTDVQKSLRETITDEHGVVQPRFTQKHQRELRTGVSGYVEGHGRQIIEANAGDHLVMKDVTGWSGEDVGLLIETLHMWNTLEDFGVTSFVEDIYKIDFSILGDGNAFDPLQINHMRQVLSHLVGSYEGYDGDIAKLEEHKTLLQNQSRLLSKTQMAFGWQNDKSGTQRTLQKLGLHDSEGRPNLSVIKAFGNYTKKYYFNGEIDHDRLALHLAGAKEFS